MGDDPARPATPLLIGSGSTNLRWGLVAVLGLIATVSLYARCSAGDIAKRSAQVVATNDGANEIDRTDTRDAAARIAAVPSDAGHASVDNDAETRDGSPSDATEPARAAQAAPIQAGPATDVADTDEEKHPNDAATAENTAAAASDTADAVANNVVPIDDANENAAPDTGNSTTRSASRTDQAASAATQKPEPTLTAEQALDLARAAWQAGNARDTYKYANKSRFKSPSDEATELATLAACKMKLDESAKSTFRQLRADRRKRTRTACRDFGVRVGL